MVSSIVEDGSMDALSDRHGSERHGNETEGFGVGCLAKRQLARQTTTQVFQPQVSIAGRVLRRSAKMESTGSHKDRTCKDVLEGQFDVAGIQG